MQVAERVDDETGRKRQRQGQGEEENYAPAGSNAVGADKDVAQDESRLSRGFWPIGGIRLGCGRIGRGSLWQAEPLWLLEVYTVQCRVGSSKSQKPLDMKPPSVNA
jgi:hypothetical protein